MAMSLTQQQQRTIFITGANKGIGFCVIKELLKEKSADETLILLGSRDLNRGQRSLEELGSPPNVHLLQLDMSSTDSISKAVWAIKTNYGGQLDIVINNAGVLFKNDLTAYAARQTFAVNYYGIKLLNEQLVSMMKANGRIINVSSQVGPLVLQESSSILQEKYTSPTLTVQELDRLVEDFIGAVENGTVQHLGYRSAKFDLIYGISKAALNSLSQIEAREWSAKNHLLVISVSPGYCTTDMTKNAPDARSPELGAASILYVVNAHPSELENGGFYRDGTQLPLIFEPMSAS